eukprot:285826_1
MDSLAEAAPLLIGISSVIPNGGDNQPTEEEKKEQEDEETSAGPFACFVWCCAKSTKKSFRQKLQFTGWIILGVLAMIFYGVYLNMDSDGSQLNWGYFLCAGLSIIMAMYSTFSFSEIFKLKKVIDDLVDTLNGLFESRERIEAEVKNLKDVRDRLAQIELDQSITNASLRAQEKEFRNWLEQRQNLSKKNIKKSDKIQQDLQRKIEEAKRDIRQHERDILFNAFDVFETMDDNEKGSGLNREEFELLIKALPIRYKNRFRQSGITFDEFSGGDDVIDHNEFAKFLQDLIVDEVNEIAKNHGINIPGIRDGLEFTDA